MLRRQGNHFRQVEWAPFVDVVRDRSLWPDHEVRRRPRSNDVYSENVIKNTVAVALVPFNSLRDIGLYDCHFPGFVRQ